MLETFYTKCISAFFITKLVRSAFDYLILYQAEIASNVNNVAAATSLLQELNRELNSPIYMKQLKVGAENSCKVNEAFGCNCIEHAHCTDLLKIVYLFDSRDSLAPAAANAGQCYIIDGNDNYLCISDMLNIIRSHLLNIFSLVTALFLCCHPLSLNLVTTA